MQTTRAHLRSTFPRMPLFATVAVLLQFLLAAEAGLVGRIIGGSQTSTSEHLHQVSIQTQSNFHFCGGSVIGQNWFLTAAHCTFGQTPSQIKVVVDRSNTHEEYQVSSITSHPDYINGNSQMGFMPYDIALVKTDTPITDAATYIIPLPDSDETYIGENCTITGWGYVEGFAFTDTLMETWGAILDHAGCHAYFSVFYNHTHNICIHNAKSVACTGDSGGPMVCQGKLAGVTSFGHYECNPLYVSVYTKVATFRDWIKTVTGI